MRDYRGFGRRQQIPPRRSAARRSTNFGHLIRGGTKSRIYCMNRILMGFTLIVSLAVVVSAQDKPRVYVQGKGSENVTSSGSGGGGKHWGAWGSSSTVDSHDEAMEVTKDLQKDCSAVTITLNQSNADYTIMLNRESKKNRGLLRSNSQVQVANRVGDVIGTNATHTVGNASKDACQLIAADWQTHGRLPAPAAADAVPPVAMAIPLVQPAVAHPGMAQPAGAVSPAQVVTVAAPLATAQTASSTGAAAGGTGSNGESLAEAARRAKQHAACLELARDNPSVTCK